MKSRFPITFALLLFLSTGARINAQVTPPFRQCPPIGADASCAILVVVTDSGIQVATDSSQGPFDQIEDTLIGVQNNSSGTVFSLPLSAATPIFSFDGDGLCLFISCPWPHPTRYEGQTSTGGATSFSNINANETSGTVNFAGGIPPGGSAFFSLELRIQTLCNPLNVQPVLKQFSSPWGPHLYDNATAWATSSQKTTIARWGCNLTSAVMLINYQASQQGNNFRSDPDDLNNWLEANSTPYKTSGSVWGPDVQKYVAQRTNGTLRVFYQGASGRDDFALDNYLCTNNPVILQVPIADSSHFVLATGQIIVGGLNTFQINDPGYNRSDLSGYGYRYLGLRKYSSSPTPPHVLLVTGHSPIEFLITDPAGNRTGFDPTTNTHFQQIPSSSYTIDPILDDIDPLSGDTTPIGKNLEVLAPASGEYSLTVFGTGTGQYTIDFIAHDLSGNESVKTVAGSTIPGATSSFRIVFSSAVGSTVSVARIVSFDSLATDVRVAMNGGQVDNAGVANSLLQKLDAASSAVGRGQVGAGVNILTAFLNEVYAQTGNHVSEAAANLLTGDAGTLIASLGP